MFEINNVFRKQYPVFYRRHPLISRCIIRALKRLWHEEKFQAFQAGHKDLEGIDLINAGFRHLDINLTIKPEALERIPSKGPLVIACNHPTGAIEGLGLLTLIYNIRQDVKLVQGNILRNALGMHDLSIEVDNLSGSISAKAYREVTRHLKNGGALIMFPAGEVARPVRGVIQEKTWHGGFLRFARACHADILPVYIKGRNSPLFYRLGKIWKPLSMLRVVPELLLHENSTFPVSIGQVITAESIEQAISNGSSQAEIIADIRSQSLVLEP